MEGLEGLLARFCYTENMKCRFLVIVLSIFIVFLVFLLCFHNKKSLIDKKLASPTNSPKTHYSIDDFEEYKNLGTLPVHMINYQSNDNAKEEFECIERDEKKELFSKYKEDKTIHDILQIESSWINMVCINKISGVILLEVSYQARALPSSVWFKKFPTASYFSPLFRNKIGCTVITWYDNNDIILDCSRLYEYRGEIKLQYLINSKKGNAIIQDCIKPEGKNESCKVYCEKDSDCGVGYFCDNVDLHYCIKSCNAPSQCVSSGNVDGRYYGRGCDLFTVISDEDGYSRLSKLGCREDARDW